MKEILNNKKVIVFDGVCKLCNKYVLFIARNDTEDIFRFISLQNKKVLKELERREFSSNNNESILLIDKSNIQIPKKVAIRLTGSAIAGTITAFKFPKNK